MVLDPGHNGGNGSDLGGLRLPDVPKVFIETANMRNATDASKIESPGFRKRLVRGIACGLEQFLGPINHLSVHQ